VTNNYKATILWVDDESNILAFNKLFFGKRGYRVVTFENGINALEELKKNDYDLLVTDFNNTEMDGRELIIMAKKLRPHLRTMFCSGCEEIKEIAREIDCDAYINKPIDLEQLLATVEKVLGQKTDDLRTPRVNTSKPRTIYEILDENLRLTTASFQQKFERRGLLLQWIGSMLACGAVFIDKTQVRLFFWIGALLFAIGWYLEIISRANIRFWQKVSAQPDLSLIHI